jgi:cytochrome c oxidase assembly protein subunit 15
MLIQLAITGLLAALLPLAMVWVSADANKYRKLIWVVLFLTFDLIVFGGFTRLTDSGLGCPDWPGCYGHANPFQADSFISAAASAMPSGPVTVVKAWIEMIHRYLAMMIGVLLLAVAFIAWRRWLKSARLDSRFSPRIPSLLVGFVCLQGAFGAWTVTMKLQPVIVTMHLLLGLGLLALLTWLAARQEDNLQVESAAYRLRVPALLVSLLLLLQLALGGWVSTNYAALACSDFPLCQGSLLPPMDFTNGFTIWRKLGMTADGSYLPFAALTAIHWVHRMFAIVVACGLLWLALKAMKIGGLQKVGRWLIAGTCLQILTGLITVYFQWPLALAVMHNAGAALMVLLLSMLNYRIQFAAGLDQPANDDSQRNVIPQV